MLDAPALVDVAPVRAAVIPLLVPRARIRDVMGPTLGELHAAVTAQGLAPAGPWFTSHRRVDPDVFDLDVGIPVDGPVAPAGHVRAGGLPGGRAARAVYRGPYEALASAWGELGAWIAAAGHRPGAAVWESYLVGPETTPDPAEWRTELVRLLDG